MKIRIAVAVARDGTWQAQGYFDPESRVSSDTCLDYSKDGVIDCMPPRLSDNEFHVVYVEADVPLPPEPPVVEGKVAD